MNDTLVGVSPPEPAEPSNTEDRELSPVELAAVQDLVRQARQAGIALTGPNRGQTHLAAELDHVREEDNTVRLHASIGYVTPDDEHDGRGDAIRTRRRHGLERARQERLDYRRGQQGQQP